MTIILRVFERYHSWASYHHPCSFNDIKQVYWFPFYWLRKIKLLFHTHIRIHFLILKHSFPNHVVCSIDNPHDRYIKLLRYLIYSSLSTKCSLYSIWHLKTNLYMIKDSPNSLYLSSYKLTSHYSHTDSNLWNYQKWPIQYIFHLKDSLKDLLENP